MSGRQSGRDSANQGSARRPPAAGGGRPRAGQSALEGGQLSMTDGSCGANTGSPRRSRKRRSANPTSPSNRVKTARAALSQHSPVHGRVPAQEGTEAAINVWHLALSMSCAPRPCRSRRGLPDEQATAQAGARGRARRQVARRGSRSQAQWFILSRGLDKVRRPDLLRARAVSELREAQGDTPRLEQAGETWTSLGPLTMTMMSWTMGRVSACGRFRRGPPTRTCCTWEGDGRRVEDHQRRLVEPCSTASAR
jgi:hypothetical protein